MKNRYAAANNSKNTKYNQQGQEDLNSCKVQLEEENRAKYIWQAVNSLIFLFSQKFMDVGCVLEHNT